MKDSYDLNTISVFLLSQELIIHWDYLLLQVFNCVEKHSTPQKKDKAQSPLGKGDET